MRFPTCKCQFVGILWEFILCLRTLKLKTSKKLKLQIFFHQQTRSSGKAPICFRQPISHLKSVYLARTIYIERAWFWSWNIKNDSFNRRNNSKDDWYRFLNNWFCKSAYLYNWAKNAIDKFLPYQDYLVKKPLEFDPRVCILVFRKCEKLQLSPTKVGNQTKVPVYTAFISKKELSLCILLHVTVNQLEYRFHWNAFFLLGAWTLEVPNKFN